MDHRSLNTIMMNANEPKQACSNCCQRERCMPIGLVNSDLERLDSLVTQRRRIQRGKHVFRAGAPFHALFAIRTGFFKIYESHEDGHEHITGFHMAGEVIGMDAISTAQNTCHAVALEDSEICEIPFQQLEDLCRELPALQHHFHKLMSSVIIRGRGIMMMLGGMSAEERLAAFFLDLSQRYAARGYSATEFHLRMKRYEIGNFLGMKMETVSRTLAKFQEHRLIAVNNRHIELYDLARLRQLVNREIPWTQSSTLPDTSETRTLTLLQH